MFPGAHINTWLVGPSQFTSCWLQVPDGISTEVEGNHLGALIVIGLGCTIQAHNQ